MTTKQPQWKLIANLGDVHPIDHGGYFVYVDETGVYQPQAELLISEDDELADPVRWTVYRFSLDRLERYKDNLIPYGFTARESELPYPLESYNEWFVDDLANVAEASDITLRKMRSMLCSKDPVLRAWAYRSIGEYHGWENFDGYPLTFTDRAEVEARYKEVK